MGCLLSKCVCVCMQNRSVDLIWLLSHRNAVCCVQSTLLFKPNHSNDFCEARKSRGFIVQHTHTQTADWLITSVRSHPNIYEYAFVLPHFSKPLPEFNVLVSWFHISNSNSFFGRSILLFSFSILFVFAFVSLSLWFVLRSWQLLLDGCRCALHCNIYMLACYFYDR